MLLLSFRKQKEKVSTNLLPHHQVSMTGQILCPLIPTLTLQCSRNGPSPVSWRKQRMLLFRCSGRRGCSSVRIACVCFGTAVPEHFASHSPTELPIREQSRDCLSFLLISQSWVQLNERKPVFSACTLICMCSHMCTWKPLSPVVAPQMWSILFVTQVLELVPSAHQLG